ncbi:MAG: 1-(5-phosphoribosyl)-5-[(5-phosphoribosylamino)methylideneamino]imidazole-4-carboxamide isomerase [Clostridiales bacterium]|nr:1-(5-phosphoribosyl)-5-[(5-phosphoribosylamino)methylideneamino]imidazole-4-carboxamide isomerase [Clostridiales bacterium]
MTIYPAIDIKGGKCVRLVQGRSDQQTVYSDNPVEVALKWESKGAKFIHVVDLDGAFQGKSKNDSIIKEMIKEINIPVQLGGGIRDIQKISYLLDELGISRVILGTVAIQDPGMLGITVKKYGNKIAVGIDARDGRVAIKGWMEEADITPVDLGKRVRDMGVETVIYTDILKDGMLEGPNISTTREMIQQTELNIIASGGVSQIQHIKDLKAIGASGVIIGKALYTGMIKLEDALKFENNVV